MARETRFELSIVAGNDNFAVALGDRAGRERSSLLGSDQPAVDPVRDTPSRDALCEAGGQVGTVDGGKRVSPHTIRHTTAVHLLRAGVDINTIRAWLGHVSLDTTHVYAEVDMEMKAKALASVDISDLHHRPQRGSALPSLMAFLKALRAQAAVLVMCCAGQGKSGIPGPLPVRAT